MRRREKILKLSSNLEKALNKAYDLTADEQLVKRFLRDNEFAALHEEDEVRRLGCEIAFTYYLIRKYVDIEFSDYEFLVKTYSY